MNIFSDLRPAVEEAILCVQAVLSDICDSLFWLLQTIVSQIDNREIATLLLLLAAVVFVFVKGNPKSILISMHDIVKAVLDPKIIIPAFLLITYSSVIFLVMFKIGIWTSDILLDTLLEIAFVGFSSLFIAVKAHSITSIYKQFVLPEIGIGAVVACYIGIESFSLPVEIVLQLSIFIFTFFQAYGKHRPDGKAVAKLSGCILAVIGFAVLAAETTKLVNGWSSIDWATELESIAMGVYYPIFMMPFAIALGYYAAYEMLGIRIRMNAKEIKFLSKAHLYFLLFPSLINIKHFSYYEVKSYVGCLSWREQADFIKDYKKQLQESAAKENAKLERMEFGLGKVGFDEDGIWQDWENLEKIKTNLWTIAGIQNRNWQENHKYSASMQMDFVDIFTPHGCTSGSYVSEDRKSYACWMSNGTGFTFGVGASNGDFPPMKYEGATPPLADQTPTLSCFFDSDDEAELPHWAEDFHVDDSYR